MKHIDMVLGEKRVLSITLYPRTEGMVGARIQIAPKLSILLRSKTYAELDELIVDKVEEVIYR